MFTGLITAVGVVEAVTAQDGGRDLVIRAPWDDVVLGEDRCRRRLPHRDPSQPGHFAVHVVVTSLDRTQSAITSRASCEPRTRPARRRPPRWPSGAGHVDGVGTITAVVQREDAWLIDVAVPPVVADVSIPLGSITVDGVSLTVNAIPAPGTIQLSIIPFTLEHTTLGDRRPGDRVQLEGDTVGKYVRELGGAWRSGEAG
jgi:riboflavin synthase